MSFERCNFVVVLGLGFRSLRILCFRLWKFGSRSGYSADSFFVLGFRKMGLIWIVGSVWLLEKPRKLKENEICFCFLFLFFRCLHLCRYNRKRI